MGFCKKKNSKTDLYKEIDENGLDHENQTKNGPVEA